MEIENCKISGMLLGLALAAAALFTACRSDSSSGAVNDGTPNVSYGEMTDGRDGQTYRTVVIGTQTWMAENLNYAVDSSWCYENSADSCTKYGRLYQWTAAMNINAAYNSAAWGGSDVNRQGVCPAGWHLPSHAEWTMLLDFTGGEHVAGRMLKSASGWDGNGTDSYGFSALPAGDRFYGGMYGSGFESVGNSAYFWIAMGYDAYSAYAGDLYYASTYMGTGGTDKLLAVSVRCVKDL